MPLPTSAFFSTLLCFLFLSFFSITYGSRGISSLVYILPLISILHLSSLFFLVVLFCGSYLAAPQRFSSCLRFLFFTHLVILCRPPYRSDATPLLFLYFFSQPYCFFSFTFGMCIFMYSWSSFVDSLFSPPYFSPPQGSVSPYFLLDLPFLVNTPSVLRVTFLFLGFSSTLSTTLFVSFSPYFDSPSVFRRFQLSLAARAVFESLTYRLFITASFSSFAADLTSFNCVSPLFLVRMTIWVHVGRLKSHLPIVGRDAPPSRSFLF